MIVPRNGDNLNIPFETETLEILYLEYCTSMLRPNYSATLFGFILYNTKGQYLLTKMSTQVEDFKLLNIHTAGHTKEHNFFANLSEKHWARF